MPSLQDESTVCTLMKGKQCFHQHIVGDCQNPSSIVNGKQTGCCPTKIMAKVRKYISVNSVCVHMNGVYCVLYM